MENVIIISALDENRVIGNKNKLPWHLPADFKHFKATTKGHALIMGRKTHESIGRALPDRLTIVLTRNETFKADGVVVMRNLPGAIEYAKKQGHELVFIAGGATIYQQGLRFASKMMLSHVNGVHEGDTLFPAWDEDEWTLVEEQPNEGFVLKTYVRKLL